MAINYFDTVQISTILNAVVKQAAGVNALAGVNTSDFVAVAKVGLEAGYDKLSTAISQLLSRTIISNRPYSEKLRLMDIDTMQYGNHVRKIQFLDTDWVDNEAYKLQDGSSVDAWEVRKPKAFQDNFYGKVTAQRWVTIYRDQLKEAMRGPAEFGSFFAGLMTNEADQVAMKNEETKRMTLANLIGGTYSGGTAQQVVKLVTDYNAETGGTYTLAQLKAPGAFEDFARFIFGRVTAVSRALTDRTVLYHQNPTAATPVSGYVHRHTPVKDQNLVIFAPFFDRVNSNVLSTSFNDEYLKLMRHESVNFWQNPLTPQGINITASYTDNAGAIHTDAFNNGNVLAVLFDREAAGVTLVGDAEGDSVYNPRGKYYNHFIDFESRYYNDNFENCVVFTLE